jgi:hypothetical protein
LKQDASANLADPEPPSSAADHDLVPSVGRASQPLHLTTEGESKYTVSSGRSEAPPERQGVVVDCVIDEISYVESWASAEVGVALPGGGRLRARFFESGESARASGNVGIPRLQHPGRLAMEAGWW